MRGGAPPRQISGGLELEFSYTSVDALAERAFELRDCLGSIRAQDLRVSTGEFCLRCGGGPSTTVGRKGRTREVCVSCRHPWTQDVRGERDNLRGKIKAYARVGANDARMARELDEWRRIAPVVFKRPPLWTPQRWQFALLAWELCLCRPVRGLAGVALFGQEGPQAVPGLDARDESLAALASRAAPFRRWWTEWRVRDHVDKARRAVERRATRWPALIGRRRDAA